VLDASRNQIATLAELPAIATLKALAVAGNPIVSIVAVSSSGTRSRNGSGGSSRGGGGSRDRDSGGGADLVAVKRVLLAQYPSLELMDGSAVVRDEATGDVVGDIRPCTAWGE
jgi:hypothetical protein